MGPGHFEPYGVSDDRTKAQFQLVLIPVWAAVQLP
jgi:hypothetical protein